MSTYTPVVVLRDIPHLPLQGVPAELTDAEHAHLVRVMGEALSEGATITLDMGDGVVLIPADNVLTIVLLATDPDPEPEDEDDELKLQRLLDQLFGGDQ